MQKHLKKTVCTAAVGLVCSWSAQAQTNVTLYGVIDVGVRHVTFKNKRLNGKIRHSGFTEGVEQGNRWGLRGSEDLGGGTKVNFAIENSFSLLNGNMLLASPSGPRMFGRQAWLGFSNDDWGTVAFGRQYDMAVYFAIGFIALPWSDAHETANSGGTFTTLRTRRLDNVISYRSPTIGGFRFGIGYSFNINDSQAWKISGVPDSNVKSVTTAMTYRNGPLLLGATYDQIINPPVVTGAIGASGKDIRAWVLAGSYDFGPAKLHLGYGQDRNGVLSTRNPPFAPPQPGWLSQIQHVSFQNADSYKTNNYSVGVGVPLGNDNVVAAAWQSSRLASGDYRNITAHENNMSRYSLVYTQQFTPRTQLYAVASRGKHYAFDNISSTQFILGLGHKF